MELKDTIEMMQSSDYQERFKAEFYQTKIRYNKLMQMIVNWDSLDFAPVCSRDIYFVQADIMRGYLDLMRLRAKSEGIELSEV